MQYSIGKLSEKTKSVGTKALNMRLSENAAVMVFQMYIKSIYSDKIGSVVREITSNCFDAHVEFERTTGEKVKKPVVVKLVKDKVSGEHTISFIDSGIGMSPKRVNGIYAVFFESTKRGTNKEIGGFGVGGKTPLAYTDSFFVITVSEKENEIDYIDEQLANYDSHFSKIGELANISGDFLATNISNIKISNELSSYLKEYNIDDIQSLIDSYNELSEWKEKVLASKLPKIKYTYAIVAGESSPEIHKFNTEFVDEHNGTEVKVPIKTNDINDFSFAILKQLYYFENVYFQGFEDYSNVENDYQIFKGKNFLYRNGTLSYSNDMHVCVGKVAYPINYDMLGLNSYDHRVPVALKFEIGELRPTASRESLDYKDNPDENYYPSKIIREKIEATKQELSQMLAKQHDNVVDLKSYYESKNNLFHLKLGEKVTKNSDGTETISNVVIGLSSILTKKDIEFPNFPYNDLKIPNHEDIIQKFYKVRKFGRKEGRYSKKYVGSWNLVSEKPNMIHVKNLFNRKVIKQGYLNYKFDKYYLHTPINIDDSITLSKLRLAFGSEMSTGTDINGLPIKTVIVEEKKANKLIKAIYNEVKEHVESNSIDYDALVVPEEFIESRKKKRISKEILKTTIPFTTDTYVKRSNSRLSFDKLAKFKGKIFYGEMDDNYLHRHIKEVHEILFTPKWICKIFSSYGVGDYISNVNYYNNKGIKNTGILFVRTSKTNIKYFEMLENAFAFDKYIPLYVNRKLDLIPKLKLIKEFVNKYTDIDNHLFMNRGFQHISPEIAEKATKIKNTYNEYEKYEYVNIVAIENLKSNKYFDVKKYDEAVKNAKLDGLDELNYLLDLKEKNKDYLRWFDIPYYNDINPKCNNHDKLIELIKLVLKV